MDSMLPQMLIDGLTLGAVYAIVALGYTMIYGVLEFINFAHGDIFMVGAFIGTEVLLFYKGMGLLDTSPGIGLVLALVIAMVLTGLLGVAIEKIAYRPLRNAPKLVPLVSAFGVSFFLEDAVRMVEGVTRNVYFLSVPNIFNNRIKLFGGVEIAEKTLIVLFVALLMMGLLLLFVNKSKTGKAIRAVAQDQVCASLMAIDPNKVISITFLVGTALGGATGVLFAVQYTQVNPLIGFTIGIKAFIAAVLGGIGSIPGSVLGGLLIGMVESLGSGYLSLLTHGAMGAEYKNVFSFVILILILIYKPTGLLGKPDSVKV